MKYVLDLFNLKGYQDHTDRWGEPAARDLAAVGAASFAFFAFLLWGGC